MSNLINDTIFENRFEMAIEESSYCHEAPITDDGNCSVCLEPAISCCGILLQEDGFCHDCWEHCR